MYDGEGEYSYIMMIQEMGDGDAGVTYKVRQEMGGKRLKCKWLLVLCQNRVATKEL